MPKFHIEADRCLAIAAGTLILAASAYAVIHAGHQDLPHAILTASLSIGVLAGSWIVGRSWENSKVIASVIILALCAGEGFNFLATADRIVAEREAAQAKVRTAQGAHDHASAQLVKAQTAFDAAQRAVISEASKPGCRKECRIMLEGNVATAKVDLDQARHLYGSNPKPTASGSPLADRIGVPAWGVDLMLAAFLSIGANGLAAGLIAFTAHAAPTGPKAARKTAGEPSEPTPPRGRKTKQAAEAEVIQLRAPATQDELASRWGVSKGAISQWCSEWEAAGLITRHSHGRTKLVRAVRLRAVVSAT